MPQPRCAVCNCEWHAKVHFRSVSFGGHKYRKEASGPSLKERQRAEQERQRLLEEELKFRKAKQKLERQNLELKQLLEEKTKLEKQLEYYAIEEGLQVIKVQVEPKKVKVDSDFAKHPKRAIRLE